MKSKLILLFISVISIPNLFAQDTIRVLFLGNSYTSVNNLPQLVQGLSVSSGRTMIMDSNMPGGMTVSGHVNDAASINKISQGNWNYVIIQEQSQIPTIDYYRYNDMYPAIADIKALVEQFSPCAKLITYMTWGRRYGGQQCDPSNTHCSPVFVDFNHMQDSLTSAYTGISNQLQIQCAPVGVVWQHILNDTNLVLHSSDNSHPNLDGSYAAALTMFATIWKRPSLGLSYTAGLPPALAQYYQRRTDSVVFGNPQRWNLSINRPISNFAFTNAGRAVTFQNLSLSLTNRVLNYRWEFGDGQVSTAANPTHTYSAAGSYTVRLITKECRYADTLTRVVQVLASDVKEMSHGLLRVYPNPATSQITFETELLQPGQGYWVELKSPIGTTVYGARLDLENPTIALPQTLVPGNFWLLLRDSKGAVMGTAAMLMRH
ncbi:MAG: PKD domain-containing protein [Bacteroidota bacterium]